MEERGQQLHVEERRPEQDDERKVASNPSDARARDPKYSRGPEDAPIEDDSENMAMAQLLDRAEQEYREPRRGEVVEGTVVALDRDGILVDIGMKSEGVIPSGESQQIVESGELQVGDEVLVYVITPENQEGHALLSLNRARSERGWRTVQKQFEEGQTVEGEVVDFNKGGLIVDVDGVRGFVPMSQVTGLRVGGASEDEIRQQLSEAIGRKIPLKVMEVNRRRNRLILSERLAMQERRGLRKEELLTELHEGEVRHGRVTSLCDFGAFVDLGGADGLVHLSELSWSPVGHPKEVLKVGQEVDVYVLGVDREKKKIALSLRRTQAEPWTTLAERYRPGDLVEGTITKLATFGAFARVEDGIEGLIHISELAEGHVAHPRNVVNEGDVLMLRVLRVEPERRRLALSLKQAENPERGGGAEEAEPAP